MSTANVWKVGSRWGNMGHCVLDLFLEYECVFVGAKRDGRIGDWNGVRKGDLFIVSDGSVAVAVGEATGAFGSYADTGIRFRKRDADDFIDDEVVLCPARLVLLDEDERRQDWGIDHRKRFCRATRAADKVRSFWSKKSGSSRPEPFAIETRVEPISQLLRKSIKYSIPIYQRPYSWGEVELRRLMEDLHQGLSEKDPVFMGTIQLSCPIPLKPDGSICSYSVIDGQQRLTTFIILLSILDRLCGKDSEGGTSFFALARTNFRTSVNKRAAQEDLDSFFDFFAGQVLTDETPSGQENNPYIANAKTLYSLLREFAPASGEAVDAKEAVSASAEDVAEYAARMRDFIVNNVRMVIIETRAGLSKTLKIFNTINSSGLDLGGEDVFKVRFYEYLRKKGFGENVFDSISEVYETVAEYNRHPFANVRLSMGHVLSTCQRMLVARCDLNATAFAMSSETFFDRMFDTVLGVRTWDEFKPLADAQREGGPCLLTVDDLTRAVQCHVDCLRACAEDVDLRIARRMFWETRYGYAWDFPVLAMIKGIVDLGTVKGFALGLLKSLVPPSIYFGKHVYRGRAYLLELLKAMWSGSFGSGDSVVVWCRGKWSFDGLTLAKMAETALDYEIAWTPKWKNLICRLVEYQKSPKDDALFNRLFEIGFDIEHIQSYTDKDDYKRVRETWGGEINKIGNLAMFERDLNRSVHNNQALKEGAYDQSAYKSLNELKQKVKSWTKEDAVERRKAITESLLEFLSAE